MVKNPRRTADTVLLADDNRPFEEARCDAAATPVLRGPHSQRSENGRNPACRESGARLLGMRDNSGGKEGATASIRLA